MLNFTVIAERGRFSRPEPIAAAPEIKPVLVSAISFAACPVFFRHYIFFTEGAWLCVYLDIKHIGGRYN